MDALLWTMTLLAALVTLAWLPFLIRFFWNRPDRLLWPFRPGPRNGLAWGVAALVALNMIGAAWLQRGWITCDFAGQWLMGRMITEDQGHNLYVVKAERAVLAEGYAGDDLERMVRDILEKSNHSKGFEVEGPLYPPTMSLLMWPVSLLDPPAAFAVLVLVYVQLAFATAWLVKGITRGHLRAGEAAAMILLFPNMSGGISLGQNCVLTLFLIAAGWALWARGRPLLGGLVWGLLAYKPVFAVALIGVPVLLLSGRMLLGMIASGTAFCLLTLPVLLPPEEKYISWNNLRERWEWNVTMEGMASTLDPWRRWLQVGRHAARVYDIDLNWIWMSRDLLGLPRREMWDAEHFRHHLEFLLYLRDYDEKLLHTALPEQVVTLWGQPLSLTVAGWGLMAAVLLGTTIVLAAILLVRRFRGLPLAYSPSGPRSAFLLYGGLFLCFHFMHYDLLPFALPTLLFVASAGRMGPWGRGLLVLWGGLMLLASLDLAFGHTSMRLPLETFLLLAIWAWSGGLAILWETRPEQVLRAEMKLQMARAPLAAPVRESQA